MKFKLLYSTALAIALFATVAARADVKLASPFTDHMVLQCERPVPVWGWADPGERITVEFAGQKKSVTTGADGQWRLDLEPLSTSAEPRDFVVTSVNRESKIVNRKLSDVLVGEVWLASGQSNMVFVVSKARGRPYGLINEEQEIAAANYPTIRMFTAKDTKSRDPQPTVAGEWQVCNPENVPGFSAVGYLFARELQKEIKVPIGILTVASGASCAQAWIRREAMLGDPAFKAVLDRFDEQVKNYSPPTPEQQAAAAADKAAGKRGPRGGADPSRDQHNPTVLFNGMLGPVVPYAIRGVLWYQGESITAPKELFPRWNELLVTDWRKLWSQPDLPFYAVQLAALDNNSNSPQVREWQSEILRIPHTALAVTIDIGDQKDVHPHNKAPLGDRLSRIALANVYGRKIEFSGPQLASSAVEGGAVRLKFSHAAGGLVAKEGALRTFELCGADGKYVPADAKIDGDTIVVTGAAIAAPTAARYAWANYPEGCNLFNAAGLPAAPFRTDAPKPEL